MKLSNIFLAIASTLLLMAYGCGGGGGDSSIDSNTAGSLSVTVSPTNLSVKAGEKANVVAEAKCSSKDLFASSCVVGSAVIDFAPESASKSKVEIPLNYVLKVGETKTFNIEVFSDSRMALEPFSYLNENNPSTSSGGWTQYSQVLATTNSKFVAFGSEVCVQGLTVSPTSQEVARGSTATYAIYGGQPPYRITSSIAALPPSPATVTASGGTFRIPIPSSTTHTSATYTITDDTGKTATATLTITSPLALTVQPTSVTVNRTTGGLVKFDIFGGLAPYRVYSNNINYTPEMDSESSFNVNVPTNAEVGTITFTIMDDTGRTATATLTITSPLALTVQPTSVTVNKTTGGLVKFDIFGGLAPYRVYSNNINYTPEMDSERSFKVNVPTNAEVGTITFTIMDAMLNQRTATVVITDSSSSSSSLSVKNTQTCTPVNNFSFNIVDYTPGTMKIIAGGQTLQETSFGVLDGSGSGMIVKNDNGYLVSFSFANAPTKGTAITAYFLTKPQVLQEVVRDESLRISYGNLTLTQSGNYLIDGSGKVYGQVDMNSITITAPLGMRDAQMIASYRGSPFTAKGGVVVGKGDGSSRTLRLKTPYSPILEGSLKVFTDSQPATIETVNLLTGEFTATFQLPPARNEDIRVSYVLSKVNTKIDLNIDSFKFPIQLEVKK